MTNQSPLAAQPISAEAKKVLDFWLQQNTKPFWFAKDEDFDKTVTAKFLATLEQAKRGELWDWRASTKGRTQFCFNAFYACGIGNHSSAGVATV